MIKYLSTFQNVFYVLFPSWTPEINPLDLGNAPSGVPGYLCLHPGCVWYHCAYQQCTTESAESLVAWLEYWHRDRGHWVVLILSNCLWKWPVQTPSHHESISDRKANRAIITSRPQLLQQRCVQSLTTACKPQAGNQAATQITVLSWVQNHYHQQLCAALLGSNTLVLRARKATINTQKQPVMQIQSQSLSWSTVKERRDAIYFKPGALI